MPNIDQRLKEANGRLKANCFGVSIEQIGNKLYLRATLPPRPSSGSIKPYQQKISIANANNEGVKIAEREAKRLSIRLDAKTFNWGDYILITPDKVKTIGDLVAEFEKDYFNRKERNFKTETTWKVEYHTVFKTLPASKILDTEILKQAILSTQPNTRTRQRFCMVCRLLANFAKLTFDPSPYKGNYSPKSRTPRQLPTDELIIEWYNKISDPRWQWVYGMIATYGLRNHEVFFLDLANLRCGTNVISVLDGKTGDRKVWPFHPEWFYQFGLSNIKIPDINLNRNNSAIGGTISQRFRRNDKLPFKVYDLRHAWAVRSLDYGIDVSLAAQQMGHSLAIHSNLYHTWISDQYHQRAFDLSMQKSDRPHPPKFK